MSMTPALMPTSRLDSGLEATARSLQPELRLLEQHVEQQALDGEHEDAGRSIVLLDARCRRPRTCPEGNSERHLLRVGAEDELDERVEGEEQAQRHDDDVERVAADLDRPDQDRSMTAPPTNEKAIDSERSPSTDRQALVGELPRR